MKERIAGLGANFIHWVETGPGETTIVAQFPTKEAAEASRAAMADNYATSVERGYVDPDATQRAEGEVVFAVGR